MVFVPNPTLVGRRNYILNWFFFVHSILADRYIHRRELWVVSLKSPSIRLFLFTFSVIFAKIWHNFANIIQNKLKFLTVICPDNHTKCIVYFINIWRNPRNNWSESQTLETLGRFAVRATKSGRVSTISWILRIRDFLVFILMLPFFKLFRFCFF